ncbi:MAG: serine hydrolase [Pyrinomonadaceae bacterium]|nr:serine hydrolase [Pyrinomonadaceae bacterium]MBA3568836.1 serine hydrolase [Pyrinomonadaceae bacterium]
MTPPRRFCLIAFLLLVVVSFQPAHGQEAPLNGFDDYVNKALREWEVPGLAIAIIKDDRIVLAKGYGLRKLGDPAPVNERTLFAIGSSSKAFTAAAVAMLVDEGKLKWDDPATKYLPDLELYDPYVTRELTVRDLLSHRSGLERGDLLWYGTEYDRDEILRRTRYLKPTWSLRSTFGYQNLMFLAAGQLIARVSGKSWDEFIRQRIFAPLSMTASSTSIKDLKNADNVSSPHAKIEDKVEVIAWRNIDNIAPAGSINSSVVDMAQWVRLQLAQGEYQKQRLLSSGAAKEMHTAQTVIRAEPPYSLLYPEAHFLNYGLGWFLHDYRGRKVVEHGGAIDGMRAQVAMLPAEKLGLVILTNMHGSTLSLALMYRIFDAYLGVPQRDWSADLLKTIKGFEEQGKAAQKKLEAERIKDTRHSLALGEYAGTYKNDLYGEVKVTHEHGKLGVRFGPAFTSGLEHWHYDTFRAKFVAAGVTNAYITFALNAQGKIETLTLNLPGVADYPFKRAPETATTAAVSLSEEELKKFAGKYELKTPPVEVSVEIVGGKLKAVVPGQPVYTLVPVAANRFSIEGAPSGFFIQFEMIEGKVKSLTLIQGSGPSLVLLPKQ